MRNEIRQERPTLAAARIPASRRGFSLVEILVVLVVLILGILLIARLFPQGFASLGYTGNKTVAMALADELEEYLRKNRENLPDAIVPTQLNGAVRANFRPEEFNTAQPYTETSIVGYAGPPPDDPRFSDLNQARLVQGETLKVPPPSDTPPAGPDARVSLYNVLFAPVYSAASVSVYGGTPLRRVVFQDPVTTENTQDLSRLGPFGYGVNYDRKELYFGPESYDRLVRVEFTFQDPSGQRGQSTRGLTVTVPASATVSSFALPLGAAQELDPQSDQLYQVFQQIPVGQAFAAGGSPFEFKVYDAIFGLIGLDPDLSTQALPRQEGRGLVARVDYLVDDWHVLRQDEVVSTATATNGLFAVKLAAGAVKQLGDVEDPVINLVGSGGSMDATFDYQGLVRNYNLRPGTFGSDTADPTDGVDLVVIDVQTGYQIDSRTLQKEGNSSNGFIDYDKGIVYLSPTATFTFRSAVQAPGAGPNRALSLAGRHLRVLYRSPQDFGVAPFKPAAGFYRRDLTAISSGTLNTSEYVSGGYGFVLFASPHVDQSVAVDYEYALRDTAGNVTVHREIGEVKRVEQTGSAFGPGPFPQVYGWIRVGHADLDPSRDADGDPCQPSPNTFDAGAEIDWAGCRYSVVPGSVQILGVRGSSVHTRVVWRDLNRPRHLTRATILTREEGR